MISYNSKNKQKIRNMHLQIQYHHQLLRQLRHPRDSVRFLVWAFSERYSNNTLRRWLKDFSQSVSFSSKKIQKVVASLQNSTLLYLQCSPLHYTRHLKLGRGVGQSNKRHQKSPLVAYNKVLSPTLRSDDDKSRL